jgi:hypothetical protein
MEAPLFADLHRVTKGRYRRPTTSVFDHSSSPRSALQSSYPNSMREVDLRHKLFGQGAGRQPRSTA